MNTENCDIVKKNIENVVKTISSLNSDVTLVAVSKTFSIDHIRCAVSSGLRIFGENKIQEAEEKIRVLNTEFDDLKWHYIGHLQTNKVNKAINCFDLIQAVDSYKLARKISESSAKEGIISEVLLELKVSGEDTKFGIDPDAIIKVAEEIKDLKNIKVTGMMSMAPYFDDPESARPYFKRTKDIFDEVKRNINEFDMKNLSMGMTHDYTVAIEEGANVVRVGSGIFGTRTY